MREALDGPISAEGASAEGVSPEGRRVRGPDGDALAHQIVDVLVDHQAADVVMLDLTQLAAFTDYFVISTVDNHRQMQALVVAVDALMVSMPGARFRQEGDPESGWVLLDVGPVVVHLFGLEERARYNLEGLWSRGREVVRIQ